MEEGPKHKITHVDVLVHPGFGGMRQVGIAGGGFVPTYEVQKEYVEAMKGKNADSKRLRNALFGVWGEGMKELARNETHGMVIVCCKFKINLRDLYLKYVKKWPRKKEMAAAEKAEKRIVDFARNLFGDRLVVVKDIKTIYEKPETILEAYRKRGLMVKGTKPDFVVYGEMSRFCVKEIDKALNQIGKSRIDYSKTEQLEGRKRLKKKILSKRPMARRLKR